ncbi:hypothetical protein AUEXF2481DRAFT_37276 [Aureobasidium subglaciale EXF-2481]|uniref:Uncharacterized protein n=1 Tax=Aureobasidium subglaciale (strain EXF-2481) TaxID=1043005 RepID=A0A074YJ71_AURSE|nr:uncharacterized protein AUEXF2481DRAFT_37276 [Aureobasidium subglaciale EXF-2481]KEQ97740.1 hypothetical protein AUEXF2481DRAFT_37276 [Aureobasidium subglaciale EXF-2481]
MSHARSRLSGLCFRLADAKFRARRLASIYSEARMFFSLKHPPTPNTAVDCRCQTLYASVMLICATLDGCCNSL